MWQISALVVGSHIDKGTISQLASRCLGMVNPRIVASPRCNRMAGIAMVRCTSPCTSSHACALAIYVGAKGGTIQFIMKDEVDMMPELRPEDRNVKTRILPE